MMVVQILRDYKNRTEYKVLEKFIAVKELILIVFLKGFYCCQEFF